MRSVLHPHAKLFWEARLGDLVAQAPSELYATFRRNARYPRYVAAGPPDMGLKIEKIDAVGGTASVLLEMSLNRSDTKISEQLLLVKLSDGWKIVSRVSVVLVELRNVKRLR